MDLNIPALDVETESQGKWFLYRGNIRLKIARMNNDPYIEGAAEMASMLEEDLGDADEKKQVEFMATLYSRYILKDWGGVVNKAGGKKVKYTSKIGVGVLADKKYKHMLAFILRKSRDINEYWEEKTEETGEE